MWTEEEDKKLIELISDENSNYSYKEISKILGKSSSRASKNRAYFLGIKKTQFPSKIIENIRCPVCDKNFEAKKKEKRKYCSHSCAATSNNSSFPKRRNQAKPPCEICGKIGFKGKRFCSRQCAGIGKSRKQFENKPSPHCVRTNLLRDKDNACEGCGLKEWKNSWYQGNIPLEVDHIDGNHKNNLAENLRLLCPTCHATTETFKFKNVGNGRKNRMKRYKDGKSY